MIVSAQTLVPFRLAVHNSACKLLGYWFLRESGPGQYAMTTRDPLHRNFILKTAETPEELVKLFFSSYTKYLGRLVDQVEKDIAELPTQEYDKPGFRKGWLVKLKRDLVSRRAELICSSRQKYAEAITVLRSRNWPPVAPLKLPWDRVDVSKAAFITGIRASGSGAVQPGHVDERRNQGHGASVSSSTQHPIGAPRPDPGQSRDEPQGVKTSVFEVVRGPAKPTPVGSPVGSDKS